MDLNNQIKVIDKHGALTPFFTWIEKGGYFNMNPQKYHDKFLKPQLDAMPGNYNSKSARLLMLLTLAIESRFGLYTRQLNEGPALGPYQVENRTLSTVLKECDALKEKENWDDLQSVAITGDPVLDCHLSHAYNLRIARYVYGMKPDRLPEYTGSPAIDIETFYEYYKTHFNTAGGASTFDKFEAAAKEFKIMEVEL